MKKALVIVNPVAGKLKGKEALFSVLEKLNQHDVLPSIIMTKHRGHATEIAESVGASEYDCIVCIGGDGTLNETILGVLRAGTNLPIGYIPAGTTNDFAAGLGLPLNLPQAAESIALALNENSFIEMDIGKYCDNRIFTYIASFGAFTSSSYSAPQAAKNVLGHLAYVLQGIKDFFSIKPVHARVTIDGEVFEGDYVFGGVCNTYSVGGIVKLNRDSVDTRDGLFEVILVKNPKDLAEFNRIVNGVVSSKLDDDMFVYKKAKDVDFEVPGDMSWTLDGEQACEGAVIHTTNLHKAVKLLIK